jgi:uncharacterized protein (DUF302 family)
LGQHRLELLEQIKVNGVAQHRRAMLGIFFGALVIAGLFAFLPGRVVHAVSLGGRTGDATMTDNGLITIASAHSVKDTIDRLAADVTSKGMTVFAHIDHAAGAHDAGLALRPTELLIFGNAKGGTPLMQSQQTIGIDLPLKALAFEDSAGAVWLSYNDPAWLAARHGLADNGGDVARTLAAALDGLSKRAAGQ